MIWVVGANGLLGKETAELFLSRKIDFIGTGSEIDVTDIKKVDNFIIQHKPDWIINCAGFTKVDKAEIEKNLAQKSNVLIPENLSICAQRNNIRLIHISSDYVFGDHGSVSPLSEEFPCAPESIYGKTKLRSEEVVRSLLEKYFIIRTSWLYGRFGNNFVYNILNLLKEKNELHVIGDQWGTPTWTADLAAVLLKIITDDSKNYGIFHFSDEGKATWFDFALKIYDLAQKKGILEHACFLRACSTAEYGASAKRPSWSVLSKEKIKTTFRISIPEWEVSLERFFESIKY